MDAVDGKYGFPHDPVGAPAAPAGALAERLGAAWHAEGLSWVTTRAIAGVPVACIAPPSASPEQLRLGTAALAAITPTRPNIFIQTLRHAIVGLAETLQSTSFLFEAFAMMLGGSVIGIVASGEEFFVWPVSPLYYASCPQVQ